MGKKKVTVTAAAFDNKYLTSLMDFTEKISPAKTKNEQAIRAADKKLIAEGNLGEPINKPSANIGGILDRNRILTATTLFGNRPEVTENDIKLIADAGFDFIICENRGDYAKRILDWCLKYNVAVIGEEIREYISEKKIDVDSAAETDDLFAGFVPHPASVGDCCYDEPHLSDFGKVEKLTSLYKQVCQGRFVFSNLLPACAVKAAWGTDTYKEYVDRFSAEVYSDYLSVDIYPFHPSKIMNIYEMMKCLETYHHVSEACRRDGKDFWLYIQTQMRWFSHLYTYTTFEMIKWQYYAAIAYGCRSIINASYNPVWGEDAIGIIDYDGNLTEQYLYVKRMNAEIAKLSPVIKDFRSLGVRIFKGRKNNPHFALAVPKQNKNNKIIGFNGIPKVRSIESESTVIAGYFKNAKGKNAVMLVNCRDIYNPYASQKITVKLYNKSAVGIYEHGELTRKEESYEITVNAGSCDGIFIVFDE